MPDTTLAPKSIPEAAGSQISAVGTDNPEQKKGPQQLEDLGISQDDKDKLIETITLYRGQWAPDRLARIPQWMKNVLYYRGSQVLAWDLNTGTWFDAVAAWKQNQSENTEGTDVYDERFICNITQMFGVGFKGMMSRGVPATVVRPENAEILADVTTAKAAQEAVGIIERKNKNRQMVREEFETMYLMGTYFKYTRGVLDGNWAGFDDEEVYGEIPVSRPDRYHCFQCGLDTPWVPTYKAGQLRQCKGCGSGLGAETFYPGSTTMEMSVVGTRKVPRAMVKQTIHSPMELDCDPNSWEGSAVTSFDQEIDLGEARMMYPGMMAEIVEGMTIGTSPNAEYERLRRSELKAAGTGFIADSTNQRPTYSQNWMEPWAYYRLGDEAFAQRMMDVAPEGLKLTLMGTKVVHIRKAQRLKEWTTAKLHEKFGTYSPSVADNVVPFNERFNDVMQKIDEWVGDSANGLNVIDGARLDKRAFDGKPLSSAVLNEIPMKIHGDYRPLSEAFQHFDLPMEAKVFTYPQMLLQFCQLIACLPPQSMGSGTLPGVETAAGQKQMLDIASNALNIYWENAKEEHAQAAENAIHCLKKLMEAGALQEISEAVEDKGSQYRQNYVNFSRMKGNINVYADVDQGLPLSPEAVREVFQMIFEEVGKGNEGAIKIVDIPTNREQMMASLGTPDLVVPDAAQQAKTEQAINVLLEQDWKMSVGENGQMVPQLPILPDKYVEDFPILKKVIRLFRQENSDIAQSNPGGWARLDAYYEMAEQMELAVAVEDAGRKQQVNAAGSPQPPAPPQPDPTVEQAKRDLFEKAQRAVDRLAELGELPPLGKTQSISGQVSSEKEILDTALKVATIQ